MWKPPTPGELPTYPPGVSAPCRRVHLVLSLFPAESFTRLLCSERIVSIFSADRQTDKHQVHGMSAPTVAEKLSPGRTAGPLRWVGKPAAVHWDVQKEDAGESESTAGSTCTRFAGRAVRRKSRHLGGQVTTLHTKVCMAPQLRSRGTGPPLGPGSGPNARRDRAHGPVWEDSPRG